VSASISALSVGKDEEGPIRPHPENEAKRVALHDPKHSESGTDRTGRKTCLVGAFLAVVLLGGVGSVPGILLANGGTLRLANLSIGDYQVSVFTDPTPVRPDSLDVSVLIIQRGVEGVPDGVRVMVTSELLEYEGDPTHRHSVEVGTGQTLQATREQADDPRYYAAKFALGAQGLWKITVAVQGEAGQGEASFEVRARERGLLGHPLVLSLLALFPLGLAWWLLAREGDDGRSSPDQSSRSSSSLRRRSSS